MPIPANPPPIPRTSMREEVYNTLLSWILEGELRPGEKIVDKDLAEKMGVSRTPVREALRRLEDKELVESAANRWTRVAEVSIREPEMIYPIIWSLEELAVLLCFGELGEEDFAAMEEANRELEDALTVGDPVRAYRADARFHRVYIEKSRNSYLINILNDLKIKYRRVEVTYFGGSTCARDSLEEHRAVLDAFRAGDPGRAQLMIRINWQNSLQRLKAIAPESGAAE